MQAMTVQHNAIYLKPISLKLTKLWRLL